MGNLHQYFHAPDDRAALTAFTEGPDAAGLPVLEVKGVDPSLQLGFAEAALTGAEPGHVGAGPRAAGLLSDPGAEAVWVVTLTDRLRDSLAGASPGLLASVAHTWARSPAFDPSPDPGPLAGFLTGLTDLASRARSQEHGLYCRIVL
ncbi:hypothetical protein A6A08_14240 [Nocardiopsis sp. TSRI0078]|uniref:hypothetical protein n=1 Tax=unclassified Nocardiopsis TaxID=2649073 RepID=UPI0009388CD0|nr:hypothetical protein [Nocardiopsis sp. TSRI0078]OKI13454.1 hypothetical protein A6A08_14240 [Nocardiopsis sp. TSRI0078]